MTAKKLESLCAKTCKILKKINLGLMSNIFKLFSSKAAYEQQVLNLKIIRLNGVNFAKKVDNF